MNKIFTVKIQTDRITVNGQSYFHYETSSRRIFDIGDFLVKVEDRRCALRQCENENKRWSESSLSTRLYLVPIIQFGSDNGWDYVVVPKLNIESSKNATQEDVELMMMIADELRIIDIYEKVDDEIDDSNWGYCRGIPVIYDYGF